MKRIVLMALVGASMTVGIRAMDVVVTKDAIDVLKDNIVRAGNTNDHGRSLDQLLGNLRAGTLEALSRRFGASVLAKVAELEQQQTDLNLEDLHANCALLQSMYKALDNNSLAYLSAQSSIKALRDRKVALLKAAAGPTQEDVERQCKAEEARVAEEARLTELKIQLVQAYKNDTDGRDLGALLSRMNTFTDLQPLCRFIKRDVFKLVDVLKEKGTEASFEELDEVMALLITLEKNMDAEYQTYCGMRSAIRSIKKEKVRLIELANAPTAEELEQRRIEREKKEAEEREAKYAPVKQKLFVAWDAAERDTSEAVSRAVTNHFAERGRSGCQIVRAEPIWEFLDWLLLEALTKAQEVLDNPAAATVEQIKEALILVCAFFKHSHERDVTATSYRILLEKLFDERTK